jgi:hypothetical protein
VRKGSSSLLFSQSLHDAYSRAFEENDPSLRTTLEKTIRDFLFGAGIRPHACSTNRGFEADILLGSDCAALVVVNHQRENDRTTVDLYNLPFLPDVIYDLATMEDVVFTTAEEKVSLNVEIDSLNGRVFGLYPEKPIMSRLELASGEFLRGKELSYKVIMESSEGLPAKGHHVINIEVRDPRGDVRRRYGGLHVTTDGIYTKSSPLAINERQGEWTISLYDRYTRMKREAKFSLL